MSFSCGVWVINVIGGGTLIWGQHHGCEEGGVLADGPIWVYSTPFYSIDRRSMKETALGSGNG
jgi:hypothetical protein